MDEQLVPYNQQNDEVRDINMLRQGVQIITLKDKKIKEHRADISNINKYIKALKEERKIAEEKIIPIMKKLDTDNLKTSQGQIKYIEQTKKAPLNAKNIKIILKKFFLENGIKELLNIEEDDDENLAEARTHCLITYLATNSAKKTITLLEGKYN